MYRGWCQAAYEHELDARLVPVAVGPTPLVLARTPQGVRAFDAACPHRGAHLGYGGRLDGDAIVCPFHGKRIGLGAGAGRYRVREHPVLGYGGMVFVQPGAGPDNGFGAFLDDLAASHLFVPGFSRSVAVRADLVVENAFDATHFRPVHGIGNEPLFTILPGEPALPGEPTQTGAFTVTGTFVLPTSPWQRASAGTRSVSVPFVARAFSPYVVVSRLGGDHPYVTITAATPRPEGGCVIRFSLAIPTATHAAMPAERREGLYRYLMEHSLAGIEQDVPIWEHLVEPSAPGYDDADGVVVAFREFRESFRESCSPPARRMEG
ncbi:MAG: Rieske 2Fe-2S domain-containing protein [Pseudonocardiales bacterium]|nr:Rieske 2Fe-2S domain-containing protein [Pseudonocardiales bacterium]MBV9031669.1 Rieske 2Fe-2S domain-containing protein [Pseudonocardiales bacterium]MBW0008713.1 Rieske 2Fe-2S domain-containing protein [Pseudonocardiales bacterium]